MGAVAIVVAVVLLFIIAALRKGFKDETGVNMPSSRNYRQIKRRAQKKGTSTEQELDRWIDKNRHK